MRKSKKIIIVFVLCLFCIYIVNFFYNNENKINISQYSNNQMKYSNALSLMYETAADSGEYVLSNDTMWPTGDYVYNETLSKCENGSKISYNETTKKVLVEANISDKCYVYFDKIQTFVNYIKDLYTTNGANNLYLHNSNLANSAEDGSYRYAGSSDTTNNFVCFGSDATTCPNDNLYRIIGVFDDKVKLIKYDYATKSQFGTTGDYKDNYAWDLTNYKGATETNNLGGYYYNYNGLPNHTGDNQHGSNNWETSVLNKTNLNTNYITYLNNQNVKWVNMIADTKWNIGGYTTNDATSKTFYNAEVIKQTKEATKIGLMNISDYGYATIPSNWSANLRSYDKAPIIDNNWIYMGLFEWTIIPSSSNFSGTFCVHYNGYVFYYDATYGNSFRPVFYLKSNVQYVSGDGTQSSPYRIQ